MSNVGKTYWSQRLENENGYIRYCCDDLIETKLADELVKLGYKGLADVAKWMGQPYETQYPETSKKYLNMERQTMKEILKKLNDHKKVVIDTTGSVIYTGDEIMKELYHSSRVVYLETTREEKLKMFRGYIAEPKPLIWGDSFSMKENEFYIDALARSYHNLLEYRSSQYEKYAHVTIPFHEFRHESFSVNKLMNYLL